MATIQEKNASPFHRPRPLTILIILAFFVIPIYSNTFHSPWYFDDHPNILTNQQLHLNTINPAAIWKTFFTQAGQERFFRPLPNLSFALNWYIGSDDTFGYHIVNIAVHILTAFLLYLTLTQLFRTPVLSGRFTGNDVLFVSLFGTVLWAINPIQTQAVTYIVQRMAQMAALFYVAGMLFYLKARLSSSGSGRGYWVLTGLMFVCAVFSKENAIMFPAALFLLEKLFFRRPANSNSRRLYFFWGGFILCAGVAGLLLFVGHNPLSFLGGYKWRTFSLSERVLTEPRIVLFYLTQIFYPLPSRLSLAHDVMSSQSLFYPWTTFFALLLTGVLVVLSISVRRRFPLFAFALLFYFINQIVESTIIPLELFFEHRNYLPSLFLFVPLAAGVKYLLNRYQSANRFIFVAVVFCFLTVIIGLGCFTYDRNMAWRSPETLWYDTMKKAPNQAGPVNNIAVALGWGKNASPAKKELAMQLLVRAAEMDYPHILLRARTYDNIGALAFDLGKFDLAEESYRKAIALDPKFLKVKHDLARFLVGRGQWEKALTEAQELLDAAGEKARTDYYDTTGLILLRMNQPEKALAVLTQALVREPPHKFSSTLLYTGCALSRTGEYERAEWFYKRSQANRPLQVLTFFLLIENSVRAGDEKAAEHYARLLFSEFDVYDILKTIKKLPESGYTIPLDKTLVAPVIKTVFFSIGREAEEKEILPE